VTKQSTNIVLLQLKHFFCYQKHDFLNALGLKLDLSTKNHKLVSCKSSMILTYPKVKLLIVYSMFISTTKRDPLKSRIPNMIQLHINLLLNSRRMIHQQITNYSSTPASILYIAQCNLVYSAHWINSTLCWMTSLPWTLYTEIFAMTILSSYQYFHRLLHRRSKFSTSQMFYSYVQIIIIFPIEHQSSSTLFWVKQVWLSQSLSWPMWHQTISTSGAHPPMVTW